MNNNIFLKVYRLALLVTLMIGGTQFASAGPFEDGFSAAKRRDYETALRLLRPLATQGQVQSQAMLGFMYMEGQGVPQDYAEALKWLRLAANQGEPKAEIALGEMYLYSKGVTYDSAEAMKWITQAAFHGEARAQGLVGAMYKDGRDYVEAAKWLRLAANQGEAPAQRVLGEMYQNGQGFRQNYVEADLWFIIAANHGDGDAAKYRVMVETKMTQKQVTEAKRRAASWKPETLVDSPNQTSVATAKNAGKQYPDGIKAIEHCENADTTLERKKREAAAVNRAYLFRGSIFDIKTERELVVRLSSGHYADVYLTDDVGSSLRKDQAVEFNGILSFIGSGIILKHTIKNAYISER